MAIVSFITKFNLSGTNPLIQFSDTTNWAAQGIITTDVRGVFSIVSPSGVTIYNNTDYSDLGCDIQTDVSLNSQQTIFAPVSSAMIVEPGAYTITYTVFDSNLSSFSTVTNTYTFKYLIPKVEIVQTIDCVTPLFTSTDNTNYTVAGVTPIKTEVHTLFYPNGSAGEGSPIVSATATISTGTFYSPGTNTTTVTSNVTYTFPDGLVVIDIITGSKEILVNCSYICEIYCCLRSVEQQVKSYQGVNQVLFEEKSNLLQQIMAIEQLAVLAIQCGKTVDLNGYLSEIKTLANCTDDCTCGDTPTLVTGLGGGGSGSSLMYNVVSSDANITVVPNTLGNTTTFTLTNNVSPFTLITNITWAALNALRLAGTMVNGYYRITDFQTTGNIPNTSTPVTSSVEAIIVFALNGSTISSFAFSQTNPSDILKYEIVDTSTQGGTKGRIYYREDTIKKLITGYDWRTWKFRRWESSVGSGVYNQFTDPGGGAGFLDFFTFANASNGGNCSGIEVGEITSSGVALITAPSNRLNNIIVSLGSYDMVFDKDNWNMTFSINAKNNHFKSGINTIDFQSATHVYGNYDCVIFKNETPAQRLSYYNTADALTIVLPTA